MIRDIRNDKRGAMALPGVGGAYEPVESESRFFLGQTRFSSPEALLSALRERYGVELIKEYEFVDTYYRGPNGGGNGSTRIRNWSKNTGGPQLRALPVQVIEFNPVTQSYMGIPFKSGGKKSKREFDSFEKADEAVRSSGMAPWLVVTKRNGAHYRILGEGVHRRIAIEEVTCASDGRGWTAVMAELEVSSEDRDTVIAAYKEVMGVLGLQAEAIIGDSMEKIAEKGLEIGR